MLTRRQKQVLDFLWAEADARRICPSYAELGTALGGISVPSAFGILQRLEHAGFIRRRCHKQRSIELLKRSNGEFGSDPAITALREIALMSTDPIAIARAKTTLILIGAPLEAAKPGRVVA